MKEKKSQADPRKLFSLVSLAEIEMLSGTQKITRAKVNFLERTGESLTAVNFKKKSKSLQISVD